MSKNVIKSKGLPNSVMRMTKETAKDIWAEQMFQKALRTASTGKFYTLDEAKKILRV